MKPAARCGTYAGYQRHTRTTHTEPCAPCKQARDAYLAAYRSLAETRSKLRWWNKTRSAALELLAAEYPDRFAELVSEQRTGRDNPWNPAGTEVNDHGKL